jgi:hypothetical protein
MERAGAHAIVEMRALFTDLVLVVFQVRYDRAALDLPDSLDQFGQVQLDPTKFAGWEARRPLGRPLDAPAAHLFADFVQILGEVGFSNHDPPP